MQMIAKGHQADVFVVGSKVLWIPNEANRNVHVPIGWMLCQERLSYPHFPEVYDVYDDVIIMEFISGTTPTIWNERQAQEILAWLRIANIFHRDIRLANLIERPDGNWCLLDFGWACDYNGIYEAPWYLGAEGRKDRGVQDDAFAMDVVRQMLESKEDT